MESTSSVPLLWQMIISFGSGVLGVTVAGFLNHFLMIRQEHILRNFNARIEVFSVFSSNVENYVEEDYPDLSEYGDFPEEISEEIEKERRKNCGKKFGLSYEGKAELEKIRLFGSLNTTAKCADYLIAFLSKRLKADSTMITKVSDLLNLLMECMKYDIGHTDINLNRTPKDKIAKDLRKKVDEMRKQLFIEEAS